MSLENLPPGFRFHPTDEELVNFYLAQKVAKREIAGNFIPELDLYKCEPWDISDKCTKTGAAPEWYFFSPRDKKYPNGGRTNRATEKGYWKATGKDRAIHDGKNGLQTGMKKTLVFYQGRAPKGIRTDWIMHEYRLEARRGGGGATSAGKHAFVLCRIVNKKGDAKDSRPAIGIADPGPSPHVERSGGFPIAFQTKVEQNTTNTYFFEDTGVQGTVPSYSWSPNQNFEGVTDMGHLVPNMNTLLPVSPYATETNPSCETHLDTNSSKAGNMTDNSQIPFAMDMEQSISSMDFPEEKWNVEMDSDFLKVHEVSMEDEMKVELHKLVHCYPKLPKEEEDERWLEWLEEEDMLVPNQDPRDDTKVEKFDFCNFDGNRGAAAEVMNTADVADPGTASNHDCVLVDDIPGWYGDDAVKTDDRDDDGQADTTTKPSASGIKIQPRLSHRKTDLNDKVHSQHKIRLSRRVGPQSQVCSSSAIASRALSSSFVDSAGATGSCVSSSCLEDVNSVSVLRKNTSQLPIGVTCNPGGNPSGQPADGERRNSFFYAATLTLQLLNPLTWVRSMLRYVLTVQQPEMETKVVFGREGQTVVCGKGTCEGQSSNFWFRAINMTQVDSREANSFSLWKYVYGLVSGLVGMRLV